MKVEMKLLEISKHPKLKEMWLECNRTIYAGIDNEGYNFSYSQFIVRDERLFLSLILKDNIPYKRLELDDKQK